MIAEQTRHEATRPDRQEQAKPTADDYQRWGDTAYELALRSEAERGLDNPDTQALYAEAGVDLTKVSWLGEIDGRIHLVNGLKIAESVAKQAKVAKNGRFLTDHGSSHIDERSALEDAASRELAKDLAIIVETDPVAAAAIGEEAISSFVGDKVIKPEHDPSVVAATAHAAVEAITDEHVLP